MTTKKTVSGNLHSAGRSSDMKHTGSGSAQSGTHSNRSIDMKHTATQGHPAVSVNAHIDSMKHVTKTPSAKVRTTKSFHG